MGAPSARADVLTRYPFESGCVGGAAPVTVAASLVSAGGVAAAGPVQLFECNGTTEQVLAGAVGRDLRTQNYQNNTTEAAAVAPNQFITFTLTPAAGASLMVTNIRFKVASDPARLYSVQTSANLTSWQIAAPFLATTNPMAAWTDPQSGVTNAARFYRVLTLPGEWK